MNEINEIQEAIETIKDLTKGLNENGYVKKANDLAIKALEKQIPKKPKIKNWCPALCPSCDAELSESEGDGYYHHQTSRKLCNCGQKLEW